MKGKTIVALGLTLAVLLLVYLVFERPSTNIYEDAGQQSARMFPGLEKDDIRSIAISSMNNKVTLNKTDAGWAVAEADNFPASADQVDNILDLVIAMDSSDIASENPENHSLFDVTEEAGASVKLLNDKGKELAGFIVGKIDTKNPRNSYVLSNGSKVVTIQKNLQRFLFDRAPRNWRDRRILKFDAAKATEVTITRSVPVVEDDAPGTATPTETIVLSKIDGAWKIVAPENRDGKESAVSNLVSTLSNLNASIIPDQDVSDTGLDAPDITASVKLDSGETFTFLVGREDPNRKNSFYAKNESSTYIYLVTKYIIDKLQQPIKDLTELPQPDVE